MQKIKQFKIDWITITLYLFLVFFGWASIYSSSYQPENVFNLIEIGIERGYWEYENIKIIDPCNDVECVIVRG